MSIRFKMASIIVAVVLVANSLLSFVTLRPGNGLATSTHQINNGDASTSGRIQSQWATGW